MDTASHSPVLVKADPSNATGKGGLRPVTIQVSHDEPEHHERR